MNSWVTSGRTPYSMIGRMRRLLNRPAPHYPLSKRLLQCLFLSSTVVGCGDGSTDPFPMDETGFEIELVFINHGTPSQDAAFVNAAARWMNVVRGELSDVSFASNPVAANSCVQGQPTVSDTVDDLRIFVDISPIDGTQGTLGQAGPCQIRTNSGLPVLAFLQLDSADVSRLEQTGDLPDVTLHEMGHVLGIGTLWSNFDTLLVNPSLPSSAGVDTHFLGQAAIAAFDAVGGTAYTGGAKVPVENWLGPGSSDSHWRESVLRLELMTPELTPGVPNPLSAITTESLADLGYSVDSSQADSFTPTFLAPARVITRSRRVIDLGNDAYKGPLQVVDHSGNVIKTILRK